MGEKENQLSLIDKVIGAVGGVEIWERLPDGAKRKALFDTHCPAGGREVEKHEKDGSRYWEKDYRKK